MHSLTVTFSFQLDRQPKVSEKDSLHELERELRGVLDFGGRPRATRGSAGLRPV